MSEPTKPSAVKARPNWDKSEWDAKAKQKDAHYAEQAKARDEALQQGRKYKFQPQDDMPEPTEALKQRTETIDLEKNLNKTMLVSTVAAGNGKGPRGPGFYCDLCDRTLKDSLSYLDHVNSKYHLRHLGQTNQVTRSTLLDVRRKIASLRAQTAEKVNSKNFDFNARLAAIRENEAQEKAIRKEDRKRKRAERREAEGLGKKGLEADANQAEIAGREQEIQGLESMLGFAGFGGGKKR